MRMRIALSLSLMLLVCTATGCSKPTTPQYKTFPLSSDSPNVTCEQRSEACDAATINIPIGDLMPGERKVVAIVNIPKTNAMQRPEAAYLKVIKVKCGELIKLGRVPGDFGECPQIIGQYHWHSHENGSGYFGTYEFYQPAFEQAKRGWWFHGMVIEGSDELWNKDKDYNANEKGVRFDDSVIGRSIGKMNMSYMSKEGEYTNGWFTAKVVAVINNGKDLKLDRRAPHHAEQFGMALLPDDYTDMCACTNNFSPQFVDGHPVVEP